ncbi:MAG: hypothetical protein ACRDQW_01170, partial [Haloechinothrix sp.]
IARDERKEVAMTRITTREPRLPGAAQSVASKLQPFHDRLTPDEQQALDFALQRIGARGAMTNEDADGYAIFVGSLPLITVKIVEQLRQQPAQGTRQR